MDLLGVSPPTDSLCQRLHGAECLQASGRSLIRGGSSVEWVGQERNLAVLLGWACEP